MKKQSIKFEVIPDRIMTPDEVDALAKLLVEWWRRDLELKVAKNSDRPRAGPGEENMM